MTGFVLALGDTLSGQRFVDGLQKLSGWGCFIEVLFRIAEGINFILSLAKLRPSVFEVITI